MNTPTNRLPDSRETLKTGERSGDESEVDP